MTVQLIFIETGALLWSSSGRLWERSQPHYPPPSPVCRTGQGTLGKGRPGHSLALVYYHGTGVVKEYLSVPPCR